MSQSRLPGGLPDLMARMGHDSEQAVMIYQHVARGADQAITSATGRRHAGSAFRRGEELSLSGQPGSLDRRRPNPVVLPLSRKLMARKTNNCTVMIRIRLRIRP
jgi:hypothetical protein